MAENGTSDQRLEAIRLEKTLEFLLEEYRALKAEQLKRINTRDMTVYYLIVALGGLITAFYQSKSYEILLFFPFICVLLGWIHIFNDQKIVDIRHHIKVKLSEKITKALSSDKDYAIENYKQDKSTIIGSLNRITFFVLKLMSFCLPGFTAIILFWMECYDREMKWKVTAITISIIESILLFFLAFSLDRFIGVRRSKNKIKAGDKN